MYGRQTVNRKGTVDELSSLHPRAVMDPPMAASFAYEIFAFFSCRVQQRPWSGRRQRGSGARLNTCDQGGNASLLFPPSSNV